MITDIQVKVRDLFLSVVIVAELWVLARSLDLADERIGNVHLKLAFGIHEVLVGVVFETEGHETELDTVANSGSFLCLGINQFVTTAALDNVQLAATYGIREFDVDKSVAKTVTTAGLGGSSTVKLFAHVDNVVLFDFVSSCLKCA